MGLKHENEIEELVIPHIFYYPFRKIAKSRYVKKISFYQESIQIPPGTLSEREGLMLKEGSTDTSLFTTSDITVSNKMTMKYYNLNETFVPLHLKSIRLGEVTNAIRENMSSQDEALRKRFDYAIIAGKAMNSPEE